MFICTSRVPQPSHVPVVFSEKDFEAIKKIGIGSKREDPNSIGRFGRGALTMYVATLEGVN